MNSYCFDIFSAAFWLCLFRYLCLQLGQIQRGRGSLGSLGGSLGGGSLNSLGIYMGHYVPVTFAQSKNDRETDNYPRQKYAYRHLSKTLKFERKFDNCSINFLSLRLVLFVHSSLRSWQQEGILNSPK